jgi:succinate dehydrogenase / fumarate reductase cytochrome b subunit
MGQRERPLSPHLQVYRPQLTSMLSIFHRITGMGLAAGTLLLTWWLVAAAVGPGAFETAQAIFGSWIGYLVVFALSFALFYHLCNGIRHLVWDAGYCLDIEAVYLSGKIMVSSAIGLTILAWVVALAVAG